MARIEGGRDGDRSTDGADRRGSIGFFAGAVPEWTERRVARVVFSCGDSEIGMNGVAESRRCVRGAKEGWRCFVFSDPQSLFLDFRDLALLPRILALLLLSGSVVAEPSNCLIEACASASKYAAELIGSGKDTAAVMAAFLALYRVAEDLAVLIVAAAADAGLDACERCLYRCAAASA